jgi:HSP20 family protein
MSTLLNERSPFDILFRNYYNSKNGFLPAGDSKFPHPLDIYYTDEGLFFEIACTGLSKDDVSIDLEGDLIKVSYEKPEGKTDFHDGYIHKGLSKKSFSLGYKISTKYDLSEAQASMENGLLTISIPLAEKAKPKSLNIQ